MGGGEVIEDFEEPPPQLASNIKRAIGAIRAAAFPKTVLERINMGAISQAGICVDSSESNTRPQAKFCFGSARLFVPVLSGVQGGTLFRTVSGRCRIVH